ncbi:MAG: hypothetical protein HKO93_00380 [Flavobacteriales bacterium]|nr:hypothetical protein [Flavobacteriales bacterium]
MKKSIWIVTMLLGISTIIAQESSNVELIEYQGREIETVHITIRSDSQDIDEQWTTFISKNRNYESDLEKVKAKEAIRAHNATIGRAGLGVDIVKVKFESEAPGLTNAYFFSRDEYEKNTPSELSSQDRAHLQKISKDFKIYAETGFFEEDETEDVENKSTPIK